MASLTQQEAERRARLLRIERYDVLVDLTALPTGSTVRCRSVVTFECREPGAETFVDCAAVVESARLNGVELAGPVDGRITLPDLAASNVLEVVSSRDDTTDGIGLHKSVDPADERVYFWTDFTPDYAHHVWACFDQPDLKAPNRFTVLAPPDWLVVSHTGDPVVEPIEHGSRWTFAETPPLSTYNLVINAGPYYELRREAAGHDLGLFARQSLAPMLDRDADEIFTLTAQGLEFFTTTFGMPFPQRKYDQVFAPEYAGAMENYGCVTWMDWSLRRSTPTRAEWDLFSRYILHELAHMWFGNIVTMRWWEDLWLNEAFAEFASNWAAVSATSYTDAWAAHLVGEKLRAYLVDQGPTTHPIRRPVRDAAEATASFDAITYPKGASVLQQLMTYVGEQAFSAGLTAYFAKHAWGNTTLQDLIDAISTASGRDLDRWRTVWLETAGPDRLTLQGNELVASAQPRPQVLAVGAYRRTADRLERLDLVRVEVSGPRTPVELPAATEVVVVNDDDLTFAVTRPGLLGDARLLPTALSRGVATSTAWDMLLNGETSAAEFVGCLTGVLEIETSASVIEPYLNRAAEAADLWSPAAERVSLLAAVHEAARGVLGSGRSSKAALRCLIRTAPDADAIPEVPDDFDLQWRALIRKTQLGVPVDADALMERDPDPESWVSRLTVRAATPDHEQKTVAWQTLAIERSVPLAAVAPVASAFWSPGQDEHLTGFADAYLELLSELGDADIMAGLTLSKWLFPLVGVDLRFVEQVEHLAPRLAPVVRATALERTDLVRRILRTRS